jgi:hypothetical protein
VAALTTKIKCGRVRWPGDDDGFQNVLYQTLAHDESMANRKISSLSELVNVAFQAQKKVPGGGWVETQKKLLVLYGRGKNDFVYRITKTAMTNSPAVIALAHSSKLPPYHVFDNKYFCGVGVDAAKRLGDDWKIAVIDQFSELRLMKLGVSATLFVSEYCMPARKGELWVKEKKEVWSLRRVSADEKSGSLFEDF